MRKESLKDLIIAEAKKKNLHFNQMLMVVAYERAIARLIQNKNLSNFIIFKGGVVMQLAYGSDRFTKDLDASYEAISETKLKLEVSQSLATSLEDRFEFELGTWSAITDKRDYEGFRYSTKFKFEGLTIQTLQFDFTVSEFMGAGVNIDLESDIYSGNLSAKVYPPELILAEKLQTVIARGESNTRAKDIYDINLLIREPLDSELLKNLIDKVFKIRATPTPNNFAEVSNLNTQVLETAWQGYRAKLNNLEFKDVWMKFHESLNIINKKYYKLNA